MPALSLMGLVRHSLLFLQKYVTLFLKHMLLLILSFFNPTIDRKGYVYFTILSGKREEKIYSPEIKDT